jgi:hypothetical protein
MKIRRQKSEDRIKDEMKGRSRSRGRSPCLPKAPVAVVPRTLILSELGKKLEEEADEEEADKDVRDGKVRTFECMDDMEKYLEE